MNMLWPVMMSSMTVKSQSLPSSSSARSEGESNKQLNLDPPSHVQYNYIRL